MNTSIQTRRLLVVATMFVLAYCALAWQLVDLQYLNHYDVRDSFARSSVKEKVLMPLRGNIRDRNGNILAATVRRYDIAADPSYIHPYGPEMAAAIAESLGMSQQEVLEKLKPYRITGGETNAVRFVRLVQDVPSRTSAPSASGRPTAATSGNIPMADWPARSSGS